MEHLLPPCSCLCSEMYMLLVMLHRLRENDACCVAVIFPTSFDSPYLFPKLYDGEGNP